MSAILDYCVKILQSETPILSLRKIELKDLAYQVCLYKNQRTACCEKIILTPGAGSDRYAWLYATYVIKGRWPEAETNLITNSLFSYFYARDVIEGRWPEAEKYIMKDPMIAFKYVRW